MSNKSSINSLQSSVTVSLLKQNEMNDISLCLEKCFSEALPIPGISRFHCIEPGGNSLTCFLYSFQSQMENRPPDVYPYESDNTASDSPSEEISDYNEGEDPSRKTNENKHWSKEGKKVCDSDSKSSSREISKSDMKDESDDGEDCVEFVRAVTKQSLSTINMKPHSKDCDARQGIPDELLSLFTKKLAVQCSLFLKHSSSSNHERTQFFSGSKLI